MKRRPTLRYGALFAIGARLDNEACWRWWRWHKIKVGCFLQLEAMYIPGPTMFPLPRGGDPSWLLPYFGLAAVTASSALTRPAPVGVAVAGLCPEARRGVHENLADLGRRECGIALDQQCRDAAHLGGSHRRASGQLIGALVGWCEHVDAGRSHRDVVAAIGAGKQPIVIVRRRDCDDAGEFGPA
jgi:hypothetical protein